MEMKQYELRLQETAVWETSKTYTMESEIDVDEFCREYLQIETWDREKLVVIALDTKNHVIGFNYASIGSLNSSIVSPREIAKFAILSNAASIIMLHNHPSNDTMPSRYDIEVTDKIKQAMDILEIPLFDSLIVGKGRFNFFSMKNMF